MSSDQDDVSEWFEQLRESVQLFRKDMDDLGAQLARRLRAVGVVVTADCNLACPYCHAGSNKSGGASFRVLTSAVDLLARSRHPAPEIIFHGGEPLLHFDLIRDTVAHAKDVAWAASPPRFTVSTNGTLLSDDKVRFLAEHAIDTQLSFDGVRSAQEQRAPGTFGQLDTLLRTLGQEHPEFLRRHIRMHITLTAENVPFFPQSIEYFLNRNVRRIQVSPVINHGLDWTSDSTARLDHELKRIRELCIEHYRRTHEVPFVPFWPRRTPDPDGDLSMCGVVRGDSVVVDCDGSVVGCIAFVHCLRSGGSELLRDSLIPLHIGDIRCTDIDRRLESFRRRALRTPLLIDKMKKHTVQRQCCDCRFVSSCAVCPVAIGAAPGNKNPHLVPENLCAFELISATHRDAFWEGLQAEVQEPVLDEERRIGGCR